MRTLCAKRRLAPATPSIGTAAPAAYASATKNVSSPPPPVAESAVTAASTGPAHGTKTSPRLRPRTMPLLSVRGRVRPRRSSGRSASAASCGTSSVAATRNSRTIARFLSMSCGSPSESSSDDPMTVKTLKLPTSPRMIPYGRRPEAPPASRMGRTGRTHGEIAVISPARKAIPSSTIGTPRGSARSQAGHRLGDALPGADGPQRPGVADGPAEDPAGVRVDRVQELAVPGQRFVAEPRLAFDGRRGHGVVQRDAPVRADRIARDGAVGEVRREDVPVVVRDHGPADLAPAVADRARHGRGRAAVDAVRGGRRLARLGAERLRDEERP